MGWIHIVRLHDTLYTLNDGGILVNTTPHALQPSAPEGLPQENSVKGGGSGGDMERARSQPSKWIHCSHVFWSLFFHNSGLQSEFYKVCSRMAVLRRGCTFIFIRAILIPKQLNGGTDWLVHRHQKKSFLCKSPNFFPSFKSHRDETFNQTPASLVALAVISH